ncbi:MAG: hypothetical protein LAP21_20775 [Acidobacteriia bacterium]|nr:hypothetical protein [Terriglobia bacterium]
MWANSFQVIQVAAFVPKTEHCPFSVMRFGVSILELQLPPKRCTAPLPVESRGNACAVREGVVSSIVSFQPNAPQHLVVSPDGSQICIPKELFGALADFLQGSKPTGALVIQFRNGGIAGLEALIKKTYK